MITEFEELPFYSYSDNSKEVSNNSLSLFAVGSMVYFFVCVLLFFRFLLQIIKIYRLVKNSQSLPDYRFVVHPDVSVPFTFMRWIFLSDEYKIDEQYSPVIRHELAHARQLHSLDIIITELVSIVFWFNPFVILLKRSLKTVHEYLADETAMGKTPDKVSYLELLVEGINLRPQTGLSSNFYWLTIKKRINMITKNKTTKVYRLAYLVLIPILAFVLQSYSFIGIDTSLIAKVNTLKVSGIPSICPIERDNIKKTSGFGMRIHPINKVEMMHKGLDLVAESGTPVLATADGIVVKVEFKEPGKGYGRMIVIEHGTEYTTIYAQLSEFKVAEGDKVKMGQVIGLVGSSGMSTGPHLHYEVRKNGEPVDPEKYY
jgi:murein DD-endopeptidase MepM/ murein hydrolase activator NlpD